METKRLTRRRFLVLSTTGIGLGLTATKASAAPPTPAPPIPTTAPKVGEPKSGGSIVWSWEADPVSLDMNRSNIDACQSQLANLVYQSLVMFDQKLQIQPCLATSWENPDPLTWIFKLRQGVKFHNGEEFEAADVAFWFEREMDPKTAAPHVAYYQPVDKVEAVDKYTAKFTLKTPYSCLLAVLANMQGAGIAPRKWGQGKDKWDLEAVGTGPFRIAEYVPNSHVKYVKHKVYWEKGLPYLDEVIAKVLPDEEARIAGMRAGSIMYAKLSAEGVKRLTGEKDVTVFNSPGPQFWHHAINQRRKPFGDVRVRRAINLCVDRQEMIDKAASGEGVMVGYIPPCIGDWAIPTDELKQKWFTPDLAKAKALLAEAGFPNGFKTTILCSPTYPYMVDTSVVFQQRLKLIGIDAEIIQQEWSIVAPKVRAPGWDFDLWANGFGGRPDPHLYFTHMWHSTASVNYPNYSSKTFDNLVDKGRRTTDHAERLALYRQAQAQLLDDAVQVSWLCQNNMEAVSNKIKGYAQDSLTRRTWLKTSWLSG